MSSDLLKTKLFIPPARTGLVVRRRLLQKLEDGLQGGQRLTLVSAPPGFGKSTLITAWIAAGQKAASTGAPPVQERCFCWLGLDESDSEAVHFWRYLIAALQTCQPALGESVLAALQSPQPPSLTALAAALINDLAGLATPLVLVLDDYHLVQSNAIHESLAYFLDHLPPQVHVVIATRSDPPLQLARRRGRGELNEIRAADLRFTALEMLEFFNETMRLGLEPGDISALEHRTEGWVVGMQMAALSLQGAPDKHALVEAFSGDDRYIADYLVEEVLNRQPEAIQQFLLKTSVLERLSAPLCDALIGGDAPAHSQDVLDFLERSNLFLVPLDNRRHWFRYHHLFAHLLRQKLEQAEGSRAACNYQHLACRWYEQNDLIPEAIQLAMSCGDNENAARMLEGYTQQMFAQSELTNLQQWTASLPDEVLLNHRYLLMGTAWAAHATGHSPEARRFLALLEKIAGATVESHILAADRLAELNPISRADLIEASVLVTRMALDRQGVDYAIKLGERVLPYLVPERDSEPFSFNIPSGLRSTMLFELALAAKLQGNLEAACRGFEEAAALAKNSPINYHIIAVALGHLSEIQISQNKLDEAERTCQEALRVMPSKPALPSAFIGMCYVNLARVAFERRQLAESDATLQKGLELCRLWNFVEGLIPGCSLLAELRHAQGDPAGALAALDELAGLDSSNPLVAQAVEATRARLAEPAQLPKNPAHLANPDPLFKEIEPLSDRELELLALIAGGASNAEIARKLYISLNTVKKHATNIFAKLGATSRIQAVEKARKAGLIPR